MTIREIIEQGLYYARTCRSLWLFGFFAGMASANVQYIHKGEGDAAGFPDAATIAAIAIVLVIAIAAACVVRFISEGALIEGIVTARRGGAMTTGEAFHAGLAHWGVLVRIALLYFAVTISTVAVLGVACVIALRALGLVPALVLGIPAAAIAVPFLVTIYLVQAFAMRIAVLEDRHALDAIGKARLFLHGRLVHGLKLIAATLLGSLAILLPAVLVIAPIVLVLVVLIPVLRFFPVIVLGCAILLPIIFVLSAVMGTFRSSIWTIGYVTQVES